MELPNVEQKLETKLEFVPRFDHQYWWGRLTNLPGIGNMVMYVIPKKEHPYEDGFHQVNDPQLGVYWHMEVSLHSINYYARLIECLGPSSNHFIKNHGELWHGGKRAREWLMRQYAISSFANHSGPQEPRYDALVVVYLKLDSTVFKLTIEPDVERPLEVRHGTYNDVSTYEVRMSDTMYNQVHNFVNRLMPDVPEGEVLKAIAILFNNPTNYLRYGDRPNEALYGLPVAVDQNGTLFPNDFPYR